MDFDLLSRPTPTDSPAMTPDDTTIPNNEYSDFLKSFNNKHETYNT